MIIECKKEFAKSFFGLILSFSGLILLYLWRYGNIKLLEDKFLLVTFISLGLIVFGAWLFASYLRCVEKYNKP